MNVMATKTLNWSTARNLSLGLLAAALAYEPAVWLMGTWVRPGYEGLSFLPCITVLALATWSYTSGLVEPRCGQDMRHRRSVQLGVLTLGAATTLRLAAQILDINVVGALLLCVDVYGIAQLLNLGRRSRAVSPLWLAVLFAFCLPLEPMLQRVFGFAMQQVSADLACQLLGVAYSDLHCHGTRISIQGLDVFVDLPCSGAKLLSTAGFIFSLLAACYRPSGRSSVLLVPLLLLTVWVVNAVRISILAAGLAETESLGFSVMHPVVHELIGLFCTGLVALALYNFFRRAEPHTPNRVRVSANQIMFARQLPSWLPLSWLVSLRGQTLVLFALLPLALSIGAIKSQPLDVTSSLPPLQAPAVVADFVAQKHPLTQQEQRYFETYGGVATRVSYGPYGLLTVGTASPLRHLHDPAVCMTANGFEVTLVGTDHPNRSTVYRALHDELGEYFLLVSYLSADGDVATSISEVVWRWLQRPSAWTMVQRIIPAHALPKSEAWDMSIRRAFNV